MQDAEAVMDSYDRLEPCPWSQVSAFTPIERARRFFLPTIDELAIVSSAHAAIAPFLTGRVSQADSRMNFYDRSSRRDQEDTFDLAAQFYHALVNEARNFLQRTEPSIQLMWPGLRYTSEQCNERCRQLDQAVMPCTSAAIRRFFPPWHLYCRCHVSDDDSGTETQIAEQLDGDDQYLCNPIDYLVAHKFMGDFS